MQANLVLKTVIELSCSPFKSAKIQFILDYPLRRTRPDHIDLQRCLLVPSALVIDIGLV